MHLYLSACFPQIFPQLKQISMFGRCSVDINVRLCYRPYQGMLSDALYIKVSNLISHSVRQARTAAGLTRRQVATGSGVSEQFLHKLEKGSAVSLKQICSVAEFLGLTEKELFTRSDDEGDPLDDQILEEGLS